MCVCARVCTEVAQSCLTLCNPVDCIADQAPLSMEFSRHEYWSGLPFPFLGDLLNPGIEPWSSAEQADSLPSEHQEAPTKNIQPMKSIASR